MDPNAHGLELSDEMRSCINDCLVCASVCTETINHCLQMGGRHADARHIRSMLDCAEMCKTAAGFMLRLSPMHFDVCGLCADACIACADSCEALNEDAHMQDCAAACTYCAASCQAMQLSDVG